MSAVIEHIEILQDEWLGCYRGGWKGAICDEAFSHPAKVAFNLARRIYEHAIEEGWIEPRDVVVDPFGGIGGCAFHGLMNGMIVVTNELEEKFVELSKQNRELWREKFTGLPGFNSDNWIILQGDSRKLAGLIQEASFAVTSPPYANDTVNSRNGIDLDLIKKPGGHNSQSRMMSGYGEASGQIGSMKEGDLSLAVSSPPYNPPMSQDHNGSKGGKRGTEPSEQGAFVKYGNTPGQLEGLSMEGHAIAVSSPPFPQPYTGGGGINVKGYGADGADKVGSRTYQSQGGDRAEGNLETLANEGFMAAISSPPFEKSNACEDPNYRTGRRGGGGPLYGDYGNSAGQLGKESGDTFWSASRTILEQLYSVLKPGAHAIFIVKAFVRHKQIVDFPGQWAQLCEAVGFKLIHDHHAMLTEHSGTQSGMFGTDKEYKVKRISFFRRLHESKSPETAIDYESVLCFERDGV